MYGVKRGSRVTRLAEFPLRKRRLSTTEVQDRYDSLQKQKRETARSAARHTKVTGFVPGIDGISTDLVILKQKYDQVLAEIEELIDLYPGVV